MLNRVYLVTSPNKNKDSKYCALRCYSDLLWIRPRKVKEIKEKQTKQCGTRSHCTMSADLIERHVQMSIYHQLILTKMSAQNKITGNVVCIRFTPHQSKDIFPCVSHHAAAKTGRLFTR